MKFRQERQFANVDLAVEKLLEIANAIEPDHAGRLQVPAWVTVCATTQVEPVVNGSTRPSAPMQNRSMIVVGKMCSPSLIAVRS
jgi:hypothetical protein